MSETLQFTVLGKAATQGSMKAFVDKAGKARVRSDSTSTMPFRQEVGWCALRALAGREKPLFGEHVPVTVSIAFYFIRPKSAKKRLRPSVPPDVDKLLRCVFDALKGIAWKDDGQVVSVWGTKDYDTYEHTEVAIDVLSA